jgi:hypothetical protein
VDVDADIACVAQQPVGAFVAHAFAGTGNKLTLVVDADTSFTGNVYCAGVEKYNEYVAIGEYEIYVNGEAYKQAQITAKQITKNVPVLGADGYTVTADENVDKIVVSITAQITAYDADGNVIPNKNGITMTFKTWEITEALNGDVALLAAFDGAEIVSYADAKDAEIVDGVLTLYVDQDVSYETGIVRLQVQQYDANGDIISCGTLGIYTFD